MRCPHCQSMAVYRSARADRGGLLPWCLTLQIRCHSCLHTFRVSRLWAFISPEGAPPRERKSRAA